jgi:hypothetical protein
MNVYEQRLEASSQSARSVLGSIVDLVLYTPSLDRGRLQK